MESNSDRRTYYLMIISTFFWAGAFIAGKIGVREFSPMMLTFLRFSIATAIVFPLMIIKEPGKWQIRREDWLVLFAVGFLGMFAYHVLFFTALKYTTAINSSMIAAASPLITSIFSALLVGEAFTSKRFGAVALAILGVGIIMTDGDPEVLRSLSFNPGDIWMLSAVVCAALYAVLSRKLRGKYSPLAITSWSFLICVVLLVPFVSGDLRGTFESGASLKGWSSVLYMAVFPSVVSYLLQQISIRDIGPSRTMAFVNMVPVFSMAMAFLILGETITTVKIIAVLVIIAGVSINSRLKTDRA